MKKTLLIIGTVIVVAIGGLGYWIYDLVNNGVRDYQIAGETVALAGFSSHRSTSGPNTLSATFAERLMPFTVANFPFDEACDVLANDGDAVYDIITIIAMGEAGQTTQAYDVKGRTCTRVSG